MSPPLARAARLSAVILTGAGALACGAAVPPEPEASAQVTFTRQVAPIVFKNCSPCHRPGESAPFSLLAYDDVRGRARLIADVTGRRAMPPWLPMPGHGTFAGERRLSDSDIGILRRWHELGRA
jgi:mono/diheme cytochrome c family protein